MYELDVNPRPTVELANKNFIYLADVLGLYCSFRLGESGTCEEDLKNCESRSAEFVSASKDCSDDRIAKDSHSVTGTIPFFRAPK
jgi:hypothetical protein